MNQLKQVKVLISKGETSIAIKMLDDMLVDVNLKNELILVSSRFETLNKNLRLGLISEESKNIQLNQINHTLISIIENASNNTYDLNSPTEIKNHSLKSISTILLCSIVILLVIVFFIVKTLNNPSSVMIETSKQNEPKTYIDTNISNKIIQVDYKQLEKVALEEVLAEEITPTFDSIIKLKQFELAIRILENAQKQTIQKDKLTRLTNKRLDLIFTRDYNYDIAYSDFPTKAHLIAVIKNKKWGLCTRDGKIIQAPHFDDLDPLSYSPLILTNLNDKFGFLNQDAKEIIPPILEEPSLYLGTGEILIKERALLGVINKNGEIIIPVSYTMLDLPDKKGYIRAKKTYGWGYVNKTGKEIINFNFDTIGLFENDIAISKKIDEDYKYINRSGKVVKRPSAY